MRKEEGGSEAGVGVGWSAASGQQRAQKDEGLSPASARRWERQGGWFFSHHHIRRVNRLEPSHHGVKREGKSDPHPTAEETEGSPPRPGSKTVAASSGEKS